MKNLGGLFDLDVTFNKIKTLENKTHEVTFWQNQEESQKTLETLNKYKDEVSNYNKVNDNIIECESIIDILKEEYDEELFNELKTNVNNLKNQVDKLELELLFDNEYDKSNAYVEIHSGAGGTESNDWASMLYRMYIRFFENKNLKYEIIYEQPGEEVGYKGVLIFVKGLNAYGTLKSETGVHRLVRISPFDSGARRHTSFASVLVTPEIDKTIKVDIKDEDLKIDVYRSGGAGGQSVNTTDSAVRITHLPTGIVVTVQNERSQIQNKAKALEILKGKLYLIEEAKVNDKVKELKGSVMDVNFGSQIRSYVMHPYNMVKDHRTNVETSNVKKVMDGDIDMFIEGFLKGKK